MNKICSKCKKNKPLEEYYKHAGHKDGRTSECKSCCIAKQFKYSKSDKGKLTRSEYRKSDKGKLSQIKYNKSDKGKLTRSEYFKTEKAKLIQAEYRKSDKGKLTKIKYNKSDKAKLTQANYRNSDIGKLTKIKCNHNRRTNEANAIKDFESKESKIVMFLQGYRCAYCGEYFDKVEPTLDHIKPVSKGGPLVIDNVQYLCRKHNSEKGTKEIDSRSDIHKQIMAII